MGYFIVFILSYEVGQKTGKVQNGAHSEEIKLVKYLYIYFSQIILAPSIADHLFLGELRAVAQKKKTLRSPSRLSV